MAVVAATMSGPPPLLAARTPGRRVGVWRRSRNGGRRGRLGLGLAAEQLLFAEAELGFEFGEALLECSFALDRPLMHGLPVSGLAIGFKLLGQAWADGTGTEGEWGRGTRRECRVRGGSVRGRPQSVHGKSQGGAAKHRSRPVS